MKVLDGCRALLVVSLVANVGMGILVVKQDGLIDRQMDLIKAGQARAEAKNTGGGIPVVMDIPGFGPHATHAIVDYAEKTVAHLDRGAKHYLAENVVCDKGVALVITRTRDSIEHTSFKPIKNIKDAGQPVSTAVTVTCDQNAVFKANDGKLSDIELAVFAENTRNSQEL